MFGLSKMVSPFIFGQRFPLATRFFPASESSWRIMVEDPTWFDFHHNHLGGFELISITIILEDLIWFDFHQDLPVVCPASWSPPCTNHCRNGHHCGQVGSIIKHRLIVWIDYKMSDLLAQPDMLIVWIHTKIMRRAVSEVREGVFEGEPGFDLALAERKEQVDQRWLLGFCWWWW